MKRPKKERLREAQLQAVADLFGVLSEPTRLRILQMLQDGPASVGEMVEALVEVSGTPEAASLLGVPATQPELLERNRLLLSAPTARADRVYSGVLYDALGLAELSPVAKRRASSRVAITSALFGLVRPGDRIPAYRLSGDARLPGLPGSGSVAGHWRDHLGPDRRPQAG